MGFFFVQLLPGDYLAMLRAKKVNPRGFIVIPDGVPLASVPAMCTPPPLAGRVHIFWLSPFLSFRLVFVTLFFPLVFVRGLSD